MLNFNQLVVDLMNEKSLGNYRQCGVLPKMLKISKIIFLKGLKRIYGFGACLLAGVVCMFLSMIVFAIPIKFALLFTFGNVLAVGSTAFVIGPRQQLSMMLDDAHGYATAVYSDIHSKILTLIAVICEICALFWYSLSYIPFARRMVSDLTNRLCDPEI